MKYQQPLTKENFWNEQMEKFPKSMKIFCAWIDEYKKAVNWNGLFRESNDRDENGDLVAGTKKYHELPYEMQQGIWIRFANYTLNQYFEQPEYMPELDLAEEILKVFGELEPIIDEDED